MVGQEHDVPLSCGTGLRRAPKAAAFSERIWRLWAALWTLALPVLLWMQPRPAAAQAPGARGSTDMPAIPADAEALFRGRTGYARVWADEFANDGLPDTANWRYDTHRNREGWYNGERQYYAAGRRENSRVENGHLIIEARAERLGPVRFPDWGRQRYTSARLFTHGTRAWTYGFFEIRARLPCGVGIWPAIWMLPEDQSAGWPLSGEIDIMEHVGHVPGEIHQTVHTGAYNHLINTHRTARFRVDAACSAMHRYQLLWTPDFLLAGIDDQPRFYFPRMSNDPRVWPFNRPMHLLLNVAVGGSWGGEQGIRADAFPARFEIDYVRVDQAPPSAGGLSGMQPTGRR
jgi:beta-glucanase (GH16 family)